MDQKTLTSNSKTENGQAPAAVVVGRGPAGLTAAIALAGDGLPATLVGRPPAAGDNRTTALLAGSVTALSALGVWERCAGHAAPLREGVT